MTVFQESVDDEVSRAREKEAKISIFSKYKWSNG